MPVTPAATAPERTPVPPAHGNPTAAAFLLGVPLAAAILAFIHLGPPRHTIARRYVQHPAECVEVVLFCCALAALGTKLRNYRKERRACRLDVLPPWDGVPAPVAEANKLLAGLHRVPHALRNTWLVRRVGSVLDFLCRRGSAADLDDHLRGLTDNDSIALEGSYSLTRLITWAIPILGFLGTVLGITQAIAGVTPERLEQAAGMSTVTDGLAEAFDTTALGLALTMLTMFFSYVVERAEQSILDTVDRFTEQQLAHRFQRPGPESSGAFAAAVERNTEVVLEALETLVRRQTELWAATLRAADERRAEAERHQQQHLVAALDEALEHTLERHELALSAAEQAAGQRAAVLLRELAALAETVRRQQDSLAPIADGLAAQAEALASMQATEGQLQRSQELLAQNLAALAGSGSFEEAVHSLTAAIHLLTARGAPAAQPRKAA
jgi:hypothetical protein